MAKRKADDTLELILDANVPCNRLLETLRTGKQGKIGFSLSTLRRYTCQRLHALPETITPYGKLVEKSSINGEHGIFNFEYINPAAFMYYACQVSNHFARMFRKGAEASPTGRLRFAFYMDETKPGNERHPDLCRSTQAMYFTILDWPRWFRVRVIGWLTFAYLNQEEYEEAGITVSMLMRFMVRTFFSPDERGHNISTGGILVGQDTLYGDFETVCADEKALRALLNLVGASGILCCCCCRNVMGRCPHFEHPYLVHVKTCSDESRFDPRTEHDYNTAAAEIQALEGSGITKTRFQQEQRDRGFSYHPEGLAWDVYVRNIMKAPTSVYYDFQHCMLASGGVAQYQVNFMALELVSYGIPLKDLDDWVSTIDVQTDQKLRKQFFQKRVRFRPGAHLRAFASETKAAVMILSMFLKIVVEPVANEELLDHIAAFHMLREVILIWHQDKKEDIPRMRALLRDHHRATMRLYEECGKMKPHYTKHIPDSWEKYGHAVDCFAPERNHRNVKRICQFSYNKAMHTATAYEVRRFLNAIKDERNFMPIHLAPSAHRVKPFIINYGGVRISVTEWGLHATTPIGVLKKLNLLQWKSHDINVCGFALGFGRASAREHFVLVRLCKQCDVDWWSRTKEVIIVRLGDIVSSPMYVRYNDLIRPEFIA